MALCLSGLGFRRPGKRSAAGQFLLTIVFMIQTVALVILTLILPVKRLSVTWASSESTPRHPVKTQMRHQFQRQELLHWREEQQQAEEVGEKPRNNQQDTANNQRYAF